MNHLEAYERFDQSKTQKIDKLFWIATCLESYDLNCFLSEIDDRDFKKLFPDIFANKYFDEYRDKEQLHQLFYDYKKLGLIAEVHVPEATNFRFKNGRPTSWQVHGGICRIEYVYAETLEDMLTEIEKAGARVFKEFVDKAKRSLNKKPKTPAKKATKKVTKK